MSREDRIREYRNPTSKVWWDGRSNKEAIDRFAERAHKESDGARHRALSGEVRLPETGNLGLHNTDARPTGDGNDARKRAKSDMNHDVAGDTAYDASLSQYGAKGVRRNA
jgi:hypothetical protein